jgi:stringent starvation protein B
MADDENRGEEDAENAAPEAAPATLLNEGEGSERTPDPDIAGPGNVVQVDFGAAAAEEEGAASSDIKAKLQAFIDLIEKGMVGITLDARREGVDVPFQFRSENQLVLNFSHKFFLDDFEYDGRGVRASLSFQGKPVFVDIPWSAVWMIRSHQDGTTVVSPEDIPHELISESTQPSLRSVPTAVEGTDLEQGEPADKSFSEGGAVSNEVSAQVNKEDPAVNMAGEDDPSELPKEETPASTPEPEELVPATTERNGLRLVKSD